MIMVATERIKVVVIETIEANKIEWGISFTDSNPKEEDYFIGVDKATAFRLKEQLPMYAPISFDKPLGNPIDKLFRVKD